MADMDKNEQMEQEEEKVTTPASGEGDGGPDNNTPEDDSEPLQLTQKQLDDIIKRAYARGARKGKRDASKPAAEAAQAEDPDQEGETAKKAADLLKKATERLLSGTVKGMAADIGLSAKGAKAALKLADFSGCTKDDDVDEESVKDILEEFIKEYPEFQLKSNNDQQKSWGLRQGAGQKMSGVEAAFFARNPDLK